MQSATSPVQQQPAQASTSGVIRPTRGWLDSKFSVYVGNLDLDTSHQDTEELIYELFLQAGPLSKVYIPYFSDTDKHKGYGFVEFQHTESVKYCLQLMAGIRLCGRVLQLGPTAPPSQLSTSSTPNVAATSTTSGANPFVSAFQTHVAQKEAELIAANPFLSSLNTHLGGVPSLIMPPSSITPPVALPIPTPGLPPLLFPPPHIHQPLPHSHPPPSMQPFSAPPFIHPPSFPFPNTLQYPLPPSLTLPTPPSNQPPLFLLRPPPPSHILQDNQTPSYLPPPSSAILPRFPNTTLSFVVPTSSIAPSDNRLLTTSPKPLFDSTPLPHGEQKTNVPGLSLSLEHTMTDMASDHMTEIGTPLPPSDVPLSLERTINDIALNGMDESGTSPPPTYVPNDQNTLNKTGNGTQLMNDCSMSLDGCLGDVDKSYTHFSRDDDYNNINDTVNGDSSSGKMFSDIAPSHSMDDHRVHNMSAGYNDEQFTYDQVNETFSNTPSSDVSLTLSYPPSDVPHTRSVPHTPDSYPSSDIPHQDESELFGPSSTNLHRSRLTASDHPTWLSNGVRDKIHLHHLSQLQDTIGRLKEVMMASRSNSPVTSHTPPPSSN